MAQRARSRPNLALPKVGRSSAPLSAPRRISAGSDGWAGHGKERSAKLRAGLGCGVGARGMAFGRARRVARAVQGLPAREPGGDARARSGRRRRPCSRRSARRGPGPQTVQYWSVRSSVWSNRRGCTSGAWMPPADRGGTASRGVGAGWRGGMEVQVVHPAQGARGVGCVERGRGFATRGGWFLAQSSNRGGFGS